MGRPGTCKHGQRALQLRADVLDLLEERQVPKHVHKIPCREDPTTIEHPTNLLLHRPNKPKSILGLLDRYWLSQLIVRFLITS